LNRNFIHSIVREPLFHFFIIGGLIFLLYNLFGDHDYLPENNVIYVSNKTIDNLTEQWSAQMGKPVTEDEIKGFIDKYIREEVLSREAKSLGLDDGDIVIKRRLVQKIDFMSEGMIEMAPPSENELEEYYDANMEKYASPRLVSFAQVYLNTSENPGDAIQEAENLKKTLNGKNESPDNAHKYGSSFLLNSNFDNFSHEEVSNTFGNSELFNTIWEYPEDSWQGPVESGFGWHLIYVTGKTEKQISDLENLREIITIDLIDENRKKAKEQFIQELKSRYIIHLDEELKPYYQID